MTLTRKPVESATKPEQSGGPTAAAAARKEAEHTKASNLLYGDSTKEEEDIPNFTTMPQTNSPGGPVKNVDDEAKNLGHAAFKEEESGSDWDPVEDDSGDEFDHFENMSRAGFTSDIRTDQNIQQNSREIKPQDELPPSLRIGQPPGLNIVKTSNSNSQKLQNSENLDISHLSVDKSQHPFSSTRKETNPFLRKTSLKNVADVESSASQWNNENRIEAEEPPFQPQQPQPLPSQLSQSTVMGHNADQIPPVPTEFPLSANDQDNPWNDLGHHLASQDSPKLDLTDYPSQSNRAEIRMGKQPAVEDASSLVDVSESEVPPQPPQYPPPPPKIPSPIPPVTKKETLTQIGLERDNSLQPVPGAKSSPPLLTRQQIQTSQQDQSPEIKGELSPQTRARSSNRKNEYYSIKHIRWYDASSQSFRISPILIQSANGPCPLLALVNALVLSTPKNTETVLVESLRTREQVSLGLLLDATFEELMSGRRGESADQLPDVGDLYAFLVNLHTGMNVNPRFVPRKSTSSLEVSSAQTPGGFEDTREVRLYGAFGVPLIHGWLPKANDVSYGAFERVAQTYEDAQNVQFHEEELEGKLRSESLTDQEQSMFVDLTFVKDFLNSWPTQLTDCGLQSIQDTLAPGQICILFRNDHFSTIYKEPRKGTLMTLVTDAGYATHDEIVWESLVDINGSKSELFAGNFQSVSHNLPDQTQDYGGEWITVESKRNQSRNGTKTGHTSTGSSVPVTLASTEVSESNTVSSHAAAAAAAPPHLSTTEQEDHDLALALQLQEEEEERHRNEQAARQRDEALSEDFISQESDGRQNRPNLPPRRGRGGGPTQAVDSRPPQAATPPPAYEQLNTAGPRPQQYSQRPGSSSHYGPAGLSGYGRAGAGRRPNAQASLQSYQQLPPAGRGHGRKQSATGQEGGEKEDKCVLM